MKPFLPLVFHWWWRGAVYGRVGGEMSKQATCQLPAQHILQETPPVSGQRLTLRGGLDWCSLVVFLEQGGN